MAGVALVIVGRIACGAAGLILPKGRPACRGAIASEDNLNLSSATTPLRWHHPRLGYYRPGGGAGAAAGGRTAAGHDDG